MIKKKNIYGTKEVIYGSVLLTSKSSGKQKWFLVCEIEDCPENRTKFNPLSFGKRSIRLTSYFGITQKEASMMQQAPTDGLLPYMGYRF